MVYADQRMHLRRCEMREGYSCLPGYGMYCLLGLVIFLFFDPVAGETRAFAQSIFKRNTLTGDWGGVRTSLADNGITLDAVYTGDFFSNLSGGIHRSGTYLDNVDLILILNAENLVGWENAALFLYVLGNQGGNPSENAGDVQGLSNIAAFNTWKLYEAWLQQNLLALKTSFLLGFYDLNSEFDVLQSANLFINSSHGIDPTFSQSGKNGPSIFPNTTLGLRVKWTPVTSFYLQTVLLNGISGDPANPAGARITFGSNDGILSTTEAAYQINPVVQAAPAAGRKRHSHIGRLGTPEYEGKIAVGIWFYTAKFDAILQPANAGMARKLGGNYGLYLIAEQTIYHGSNQAEQRLTLFTRIGFANPKINRFGFYIGGGFHCAGLIPGRNADQLGFAAAGAYNGDEYKTVQSRAGQLVSDAEWNLELTYLCQLTPWFSLQPDLQYIIHPNTNPVIKNALALGIRGVISF